MSGDNFAGAAVRLAGFAGAVLGWRPGEFWAATPAELGAVVEAMRGEGEGLDRCDVERLKRMLGDCPSTGFAGPPPQNTPSKWYFDGGPEGSSGEDHGG